MGNNDLTLEKLKIDERLRSLELKEAETKTETRLYRENLLERLELDRKSFSDKLDKIYVSVENLDHKINGNGSPGLDDRLKAIELAEEGRKKTVDTIVKTALTSIVMGVGSFIYWVAKTLIITFK